MSSFAQTDIGLGIQVYPTGIIPGIELETKIDEKASMHFRVGYNWIRHRDLGEHDDERGGGYGFSLGYNSYFKSSLSGFSIIAKTDLWWNHLDWKDNAPMSSGETDILVLQPTVGLAYAKFINENTFVKPSIAIGREWNIKTEGEPTGQGAILLLGISIGLRK